MKKQTFAINRRQAIKTLIIGSAASVSSDIFAASSTATDTQRSSTDKQQNYHETAHIRAYYESLK